MKRGGLVILGAFLILSVSAFGLWRVIVSSAPPPTPKTIVTIPEGWTVAQINEHLQKEGVLIGSELEDSLEGYLFPDTYEFFLESSVDVIRDRFLENMEQQLRNLGVDIDSPQGNEILTMASLLERELRELGEKKIASGVLWKRLEAGIPLQIDATLCFIKAKRGEPCLPITASDKAIDSPYNTYLYRGLPPGPISNPGLNAIRAALDPVESPYWYYISHPETGEAIFARTLDEHNRNVNLYLRN